jgi:acyl-CoA thioesterase FadM
MLAEVSDDGRRAMVPLLTRGYEMSSRHAVAISTVARYLEHARWSAPGRFGVRGVIRAQKLELLQPLQHHEPLEMSVVLGRVGRTSFEYVHRITRRGELVARGSCTIVALGANGPRPIPDGMKELVVDEVVPDVELSSDEPTPPADAFARELDVLPSDQDLLQHVNHARYLQYAEDTLLLAGHDAVPRMLAVAYDDQAVLGDRLRITCRTREPATFDLNIVRTRDERLLSRVRFRV